MLLVISPSNLSIAVYLFTSFGSTSAEVYKENQEIQLNQFNTKFTSYMGIECTIYDVVTVANLATENNIFYELPKLNSNSGKDNYISVSLNNQSIEFGYEEASSSTAINNKYNQLIQNDIKKITSDQKELPRYTCTVEISLTTQRVYKVEFKKKNS